MATKHKTQQTAKQPSPAAQKAARDLAAKLAKEGLILIDGRPTYRSFKLKREDVNKEERTVPLAFSSETPGEQWFGMEVLDHSPGACRTGRLNSGGALLSDHDRRRQVGVVVSGSAKIDTDKIGRCVVKFSRSVEGEKEFQDVLDGIRTNVSVGYAIEDMRLDSINAAGLETYRVTSWEPYEVSLVSIPMDTTVGIGRNTQERTKPITVSISGHDPKTLMLRKYFLNLSPEGGEGGGAGTEVVDPPVTGRRAKPAPAEGEEPEPGEGDEPEVIPSARRGVVTAEQARQTERNRLKEIGALETRFAKNEAVMRYLGEVKFTETTLAEINRGVLSKLNGEVKPLQTPEIGLSARDMSRYSFVKAIRHAASLAGVAASKDMDNDAGFEIEVHQECLRQFKANGIKKGTRGLFVPREVLTKRDLVAGTDTAGGFMVATTLKADSFIELLRNAMMVRAMGAQVITGLIGDVEFPRQNSAGTAYWVGEGSAPTESDQGFGQVAMSPKTVGAYTDMSRKLLLQSSLDVEQIVRMDLAKVLGLAIDLAALRGSGNAGQPLGIANTTGIGSVAVGTNGGALTFAHLIALESKVAVANALMGTLGYLTNAKVRGNLKGTEKSPSGTIGNFIWTEGENGFGEVNGYKAAVSNQAPWTLTKGTTTGACSEIYFANWADLLIGEWGVLDIQIDPYAKGTAGGVRVRFLQDVDVAVRHPESFAICQDATTSI